MTPATPWYFQKEAFERNATATFINDGLRGAEFVVNVTSSEGRSEDMKRINSTVSDVYMATYMHQYYATQGLDTLWQKFYKPILSDPHTYEKGYSGIAWSFLGGEAIGAAKLGFSTLKGSVAPLFTLNETASTLTGFGLKMKPAEFPKFELPEINYFFRGTSFGYEGNPSLVELKVTPTTPNPAKATAFAMESNNYGSGVVHVATDFDLVGIKNVPGNVLAEVEEEIPLNLLPKKFAQRAGLTITAKESQAILKNMGINLPANVTKGQLTDLVKSLPTMSQGQVNYFVEQAMKLLKK